MGHPLFVQVKMFQLALFDAVPAVLLGLVKRLIGTFDGGVALL